MVKKIAKLWKVARKGVKGAKWTIVIVTSCLCITLFSLKAFVSEKTKRVQAEQQTAQWKLAYTNMAKSLHDHQVMFENVNIEAVVRKEEGEGPDKKLEEEIIRLYSVKGTEQKTGSKSEPVFPPSVDGINVTTKLPYRLQLIGAAGPDGWYGGAAYRVLTLEVPLTSYKCYLSPTGLVGMKQLSLENWALGVVVGAGK